MQKICKASWPVLFVSDKLQLKTDEGIWLREIIESLTKDQDCSVVLSYTYGDAGDIIYSREDLGTVVLDWDMEELGRLHKKNMNLMEMSKVTNATAAFIDYIRDRNKFIPILLMTDRGSVQDIPDDVYKKINGVIWKLTDTPQFLSGRIERSVIEYSESVLPPFFEILVRYVNEYKYAWHTPGHMGGEGFLKSPSGTALHKFFGENVLRADLSISVPELGSLLDHSGVTGDAENFSAHVFGADQTYYVLNGTSTANQIIWRSQVSPGEEAIVDRNCHKSLNYAMIITNAKPKYMVPMRNGLGIIGPVQFGTIGSYKMSALTNSTYDGVCYDMRHVSDKLENVLINHFDEAWYAYAKFHPIYNNHFGMDLPRSKKTIFCTHSTHKLLTAFSQASMIHVKLPEKIQKSEEAREQFHDLFNESYMMHGSTSPQYSMIASLEVATKMMKDNGKTVWNDIITEAVELRQKIAEIKKTQKDWFFGIWQPECIADTDIKLLCKNQDYWKIKPLDKWHGFPVSDTYAMLDPIKLTFTCPGVDANLNENKVVYSDLGIPAAIVTNYLIEKGIVCEKTDYYSWLLLNSMGTTKGKQGTLIAELFKFKELYDKNALLKDVFPNLAPYYPEDMTLKQHCNDMHSYIRKNDLLGKMINASQVIPDQDRIPAEAYRQIIEKEVEFELLDNIKLSESRVAAVMLVPYPPGIPLMMGGEVFNNKSEAILDYLKTRQEFEFEFPGYESDIHGIERTKPDADGRKHFKTILIKKGK